VSAGAGGDRVNGGSGNDRLAGQSGADVITGGAGSDTITGGDGNDRIDARDGAVDTVTCGAGEDVAKLDENDVIADAAEENPNGSCERVIRGGTRGDHGPGGRDCPARDGSSNDRSSNEGVSSDTSESRFGFGGPRA
jgi:Ca2+-binding RTX toxin-like protein